MIQWGRIATVFGGLLAFLLLASFQADSDNVSIPTDPVPTTVYVCHNFEPTEWLGADSYIGNVDFDNVDYIYDSSSGCKDITPPHTELLPDVNDSN